MEGRVFKERYRLTAKLGSGRLADSYLADDIQMGRQVVVKVIYSGIASDPAYIQKLEAEARVAAELGHPNIARTIDWGSEGDFHFVVTEYVKGRSIAEFLSSEGRFPPERSAQVAAELCSALQLVHSRGLVHGGISSSNVFIDDIGQVKLMDVGMAWTATGRGTPQFISPEQAQGLAVDARADVYSLGIVLYLMLTGAVPFDAHDSETVIYKQVNEQPTTPAVVNPAIPAELDALVMKALSKNPSLRFQSAREMHDALLRFKESIAPPVPAAAVAAGAAVPRGSAAAGAAVPGKKGSKAWAWAAGIITVLVIAGIVLAIVLTAGGGEGEMVTVPNLVGLSEDEARDSLESVGLKLQKEDDYITSESKQVGVVSSQDPAAGTSLEEGKSVTAKVTAELRMPNVIGQTPSEAEAALKKQGISMIVVSNTPVTDAGEVGKVVSQDPAGGSLISKDTKVTLEVGEESKTVAVPDVVGLVQAEAETTIENAGLKVTVQEKEDATVPAGQVLSQDPASGKQVDKGSTVTIVVSKPPT
jgi:eukaryotic-like serine/threonine-protein kinase